VILASHHAPRQSLVSLRGQVNGHLTEEAGRKFRERRFPAWTPHAPAEIRDDNRASIPGTEIKITERAPESDPHHVQNFFFGRLVESSAGEDRIAGLDVPPGRYRSLTPQEIGNLKGTEAGLAPHSIPRNTNVE